MDNRFKICLAQPEIEDLYNDLLKEQNKAKPNKNKITLLKKLNKTFNLLSYNPRYPSLNSHEISQLTDICRCKIFESYMENNTPAAGRIFWMYGPIKNSIIIVGIEPHPNDKSNAYKKIKLSKEAFN